MMTNGGRKRTRSTRLAAFELSPGLIVRLLTEAKRADVLARIGLCLVAVTAVWAATIPWAPPFEYGLGYVPLRDITARVEFTVPDPRAIDTEVGRLLTFEAGHTLAKAGQPLLPEALERLRAEYKAYVARRPLALGIERAVAVYVMVLGLYILCGYYVYVRERRVIQDLRRYTILLSVSVVAMLLARWTMKDPWRAEIIPMLLFGMTLGIAYGREMALVFSLALSVIVAVASGHSLGESLVLMGVIATAVMQLGPIRSRRKLIRVGFYTCLVTPLLAISVGMLDDQPFSRTLLEDAIRDAVWTLLAGFLITGLLPFIEGLFGVLTEISLLELGDVAHPLLQELVRRAPGTYNHSINVASIGEAAADSIGARGLLVRVGAYFHDIGKMFKPDYFVENQGTEASRHDTLAPAMSTLIIVAHIKDGADLARKHHLPEPIIEFIEQHHGTTLVEYFYRRASEQSEANPDAGEVEESSFRYPGPKPQTVEAAVLMLADAVESASRVLVEPTPARIENLVEEIAMKKLLDCQFDECRLTLKQLRTVEDSLVKSLTAVYHGRVKYPSQRTA